MTLPCSVDRVSGSLSIMWKTVSEDCNLACDYCYYSSCAGKPGPKINRIAPELLDSFIRSYMARTSGAASFAWQGGEPLLAGLAFFQEVVSLQARYAKPNTIIANSLQTNATLITEEWARFFRQYHFLIGVSLDGPEHIHDKRRVYSNGAGSFDRVMAGIEQLRRQQVEFNILTVIHEGNVGRARELLDFYKENGFGYIQFIPAMDFMAQETGKQAQFRITPEQYGQFLCEAFDVWYNEGNPVLSERFFDNLLHAYVGRPGGLCIHQATCPTTIILEQNGDAYPCDFYIGEEYRLGNVARNSLEEILAHPAYAKFLAMKPALPDACASCEYLQVCHGGCPRNRAQNRQEGVPYPDYFCESYKMIYAYSKTRMEQLSIRLRQRWLDDYRKSGRPLPGRNEPCPCGSGRKFKVCCERLASAQ
ncbi:anaerobic sulfatase maturase [Paenibacillus sanguinis]|uniref:anaerobic sulfatase maturase n=1 Tax=Paenibacillus sanguinis TaxID=225906 RepID=UPI000362FAE8|nr:anaerobic sulfatase maturase [Paenibacillus sanguinis]